MDKKEKDYPSLRDLSPRDYMYFPKGTIEMNKPGSFSKTEVIHLFISMFGLTLAFTFAFTGNNLVSGLLWGFNLDKLGTGFLMALTGIITAFFFHEMLHKFIAQKYKLWSEFRMYPKGLTLALLFGLLTPFVFAAPGAVMFRGGSRTFENGRIAAAGPSANLVIALIALPLYRVVFFEDVFLGPLFTFVCLINAFLAMINLLPVEPLDGTKVIDWNVNVWFLLFVSAVVLTILTITHFNPVL